MSTDKEETNSIVRLNAKHRLELEGKVLAAALKQSFQRKDKDGINLAHKQLFLLMSAAQKTKSVQEEDTHKMQALPDDAPAGAPGPQAQPTAPDPAQQVGGAGAAVTTAAPPVTRTDIYEVLNVSQMSSYHDIHISFLRTLRKMLRDIATTPSIDRRPLLKRLQTIWVSRDILMDPMTRTDYDLRLRGLRGAGTEVATGPDDNQKVESKEGSLLRIGELLMLCGLLEAGELEIACDMHKAMPEIRFGTFLLKQGFIQPRELDEALLGQRLLRRGWLTTAQLQVGMQVLKQSGVGLAKTLQDRNWVSAQDLQSVLESNSDPVAPLARQTDTPAPPSPRTTATGLPSAPANITITSGSNHTAFKPGTTNGDDGKSATGNAAAPGRKDTIDLPAGTKNAPAAPHIPPPGMTAPPIWPQSALPPVAPPPPGVKITPNAGSDSKSAKSGKSVGDFLRANAQSPAEAPKQAASNLMKELTLHQSEKQATKDAALSPTSQANTGPLEEATPQPSLDLRQAVPSWQDQLDWDEPEEEADLKPMPPHSEALGQSPQSALTSPPPPLPKPEPAPPEAEEEPSNLEPLLRGDEDSFDFVEDEGDIKGTIDKLLSGEIAIGSLAISNLKGQNEGLTADETGEAVQYDGSSHDDQLDEGSDESDAQIQKGKKAKKKKQRGHKR